MKLRYNHALGAVDDKRTVGSHVRNRTEEHILHHGVEIFMVGVGTIKLELGLEGHTISEATFEALLNGVTRFVDIVIEELQHKVVASIRNREVLGKDFVQAVVLAQFAGSVKLEKILERL